MIECERCGAGNADWATSCRVCDAELPDPGMVHPDQETLLQRVAEAELEGG